MSLILTLTLWSWYQGRPGFMESEAYTTWEAHFKGKNTINHRNIVHSANQLNSTEFS